MSAATRSLNRRSEKDLLEDLDICVHRLRDVADAMRRRSMDKTGGGVDLDRVDATLARLRGIGTEVRELLQETRSRSAGDL